MIFKLLKPEVIFLYILVLHRSDSWPVRKENEVALQQAEMRMVRWMYGIKAKDKFSSGELRKRLGIDDIISVLQQNRL